MSNDCVKIRRALLSVSDKTGLIELATALDSKGIELLSTGGTARSIRDAGLPVKDVSDITGFPEMMDGRVKTLHPMVHGGLLALRDNKDHLAAMREHGIIKIDLLVVNLYPFEETVSKGGNYEACVENIDIGGPAMIRAAAKNHGFVSVVVDVEDYDFLLQELNLNNGSTTLKFRHQEYTLRSFVHSKLSKLNDPSFSVNCSLCTLRKVYILFSFFGNAATFRDAGRDVGFM